MEPMRIAPASLALACLVLAAATPAAAQPPFNDYDYLRAQQEAAARRAIDQENRLSALDARLRTDQALSDLQAARHPPAVPELRYAPALTPAPASSAAPTFPSIPDALLAESNKRVQAASKPRS